MVLPASPNSVSFSQIQTEMGGTNPVSLSEYYSSSGSYSEGVRGVSSSGPSSLSQFRGKSRPVLNKIAVSTLSAAMAIFSMRLAKKNYTGPMVKVRRGSDNAEADFYADVDGQLGTTYNGEGTSVDAWLDGATGFVVTWYDQSPNARHATNTTPSTQPGLATLSGKKVLYFNGNNNSLLFYGIVPVSFWLQCYIVQMAGNFATAFAQANVDRGFRFPGLGMQSDSNDFLYGTDSSWYINNIFGSPTQGPKKISGTGAWQNIIGIRSSGLYTVNQFGKGYPSRDLNGYISECVFFDGTANAWQTDAGILYEARHVQ